VVFYSPAHKFLFFGDETTTIPVWNDVNTDNSARNFRNVLAMVDAGAVETFVASHHAMEPISGADAIREWFAGRLEQKLAFDREVAEAVAQFPDGVAIDDLYSFLRSRPQQYPVGALVADAQFPRGGTFFKLTLLNFLRQHYTEMPGSAGRPVFK